jgi:homopolymeric O-antigen transport system permease protein
MANIDPAMLESDSTVRVYTPESPIRQPRRFLREIVSDFRSARVLAWRLFVRDISAQYRQTALGYVGALLPPIVTTVVWILLNSSHYVNIDTGSVPYPIFVLTGTMFWQLFVDSLNAPLKQLSGNRSMLNRVNFPTEALLLSGIAQVLFNFLIRLVVLAAAIAISRESLEWTAVFLPLPILAVLGIGTVIGLFLVPLGMLYKDVEQSLLTFVGVFMFLTPVVYPPPAGTLGDVMRLNPLTPAFTLMRSLLYGDVGHMDAFAIVGVATCLVSVFAWAAYRLALPVLVERLEA